jgi:hypothetical protein
VEYSATTILPPGAAAQADAFGNVLIETWTG